VTPRERDEPVRLTRIYTRGGDRGETSLGDGSRASKLDPRIRAFGAVDELNSVVGLALAAGPSEEIAAVPGFGPEIAQRVVAALAANTGDRAPAVNMSTGEVLS